MGKKITNIIPISVIVICSYGLFRTWGNDEFFWGGIYIIIFSLRMFIKTELDIGDISEYYKKNHKEKSIYLDVHYLCIYLLYLGIILLFVFNNKIFYSPYINILSLFGVFAIILDVTIFLKNKRRKKDRLIEGK
jgi:hypothetical protein